MKNGFNEDFTQFKAPRSGEYRWKDKIIHLEKGQILDTCDSPPVDKDKVNAMISNSRNKIIGRGDHE